MDVLNCVIREEIVNNFNAFDVSPVCQRLAEAPEVKSPLWSINTASSSRASLFGRVVDLSFLEFTKFTRNAVCVPKEMGLFVFNLWQVLGSRL